MPKFGVIDIGSNTIHLDLFEEKNGQTQYLLGKGAFNKLGFYLTKKQQIPQSKIKEAVQIVQDLLRFSKKKQVEQCFIFGTSILRKAQNRLSLIRQVEKETGLQIQVVSGSLESQLIELITRNKFSKQKGKTLLLDIGGGSAEYVLLDEKKTYFRKSYEYGLSKTKGLFKIENAPNDQQVDQLNRYFNSKLKWLEKAVGKMKIERLLVFSSVAKQFCLLKYSGIKTPSDFLNKRINRGDLRKIIQGKFQTKRQRSAIQRDLIVIGAHFFLILLDRFQIKEIKISPYSIREGYLQYKLNR